MKMKYPDIYFMERYKTVFLAKRLRHVRGLRGCRGQGIPLDDLDRLKYNIQVDSSTPLETKAP